jgi:chromate transporter
VFKSTGISAVVPTSLGQVMTIVAGGLVGRWALKRETLPAAQHHDVGIGKTTGAVLLFFFCFLLAFLPLLSASLRNPALSIISAFYRSGVLVFGGVHVVLPLLQASVVPSGLVSTDTFLARYGGAQAVPGPLFTFAAFFGAVMPRPLGGWTGGLTLLLAIFLPAFLIVMGALPFWGTWRRRDGLQRAIAGVNAAVVGILAAALYDPVWTNAVRSRADVGLAFAAFGLLVYARVAPVVVVALALLTGWLLKIVNLRLSLHRLGTIMVTVKQIRQTRLDFWERD